jgi:hypothetical protein
VFPIWHHDGLRGLQDEPHYRSGRFVQHRHRSIDDEDETDEVVADNPRPEDWLSQIMVEVCQDSLKVLEALDAVRTSGSLN